MYAVLAQRQTTDGEWTGSVQVPTFYLDEQVQGILSSEQAHKIANDILGEGHIIACYKVS